MRGYDRCDYYGRHRGRRRLVVDATAAAAMVRIHAHFRTVVAGQLWQLPCSQQLLVLFPCAARSYGLDLFLLSVDEGIAGYRDDSLETVKRNESYYGIPLKVSLTGA